MTQNQGPTDPSPGSAPPPGTPSPGESAPLDYQTPTGKRPYLGPPPDKDARTWGMLCHLASLVQFVGIPFGLILGPLVVWLIKKQEMPFVDDQGKECLNFQITAYIAVLICIPLICVAGLGFFLMIAIAIVDIVFVIMGAVRASNGIAYRYPWSFRLVK